VYVVVLSLHFIYVAIAHFSRFSFTFSFLLLTFFCSVKSLIRQSTTTINVEKKGYFEIKLLYFRQKLTQYMGSKSSKRNSINGEPLSKEMIEELCQDTGFTEEELLAWHT
jgi:hypothetical protein